MINRELIRTKVLQLTYAYYQNGNKNMDNAEKELLFSLSKAYDLYNYLLDLIVAINREERRRVDIAAQRAARGFTDAFYKIRRQQVRLATRGEQYAQ